MRTIKKLTGIFKNCPDNLETVCLKDYILAILPQFVICLGFTRICREIVDVAIYALYPESFCGGNLAIRKVFAFLTLQYPVPSFGSIWVNMSGPSGL